MALPTSGEISWQDIQDEHGGSHPISLSEYYGKYNVSNTQSATSGTIDANDLYGTSPSVAGGWTGYSSWSSCSVSCGGGTQSHTRSCTSPAPSYGGAACSGSTSASQSCNSQSCFTPTDHFNTVLYTGNGTSGRVLNGVGFQPDLIWKKQRNGANVHMLTDAVRGTLKALSSNSTAAENNYNDVRTFEADGSTLGTSAAANASGSTYVSWNWKANGSGVTNTSGSITSTVSANAPAGFSIVKYVSPNGNAGQTIGHGLSVAPEMVIFKKLNTTSNWGTWHKDLTGATYKLYLNTTGAQGTGGNPLISVPTSSLLNLSTSGNAVSGTFLSYAFHSVPGYSKVGSYTGNGSSTGTVVTTGFAPRYVMVKRVDSAGNWIVWDKVRDTTNTATRKLYPNLSNSEDTGGGGDIDLDSNGFQLRSTWGDLNGSGATYIYLAIA